MGSSKTSWQMLHLRCRLMSSGSRNSRFPFAEFSRPNTLIYYMQNGAICNLKLAFIKIIMQPLKPSSGRTAFTFFLSSTLAAAAFAIAALTTMPVFDADLAVQLFQVMIKVSAVALMVAEVSELAADPAPTTYAWALCLLSMVGNCLYVWSSSAYEGFNSGVGYMVGEFFVSLAYELKILALVLTEKSFKRLLRQEKRRFFRYVCIALGTMFFLIASIVLELELEAGAWAAGLANSLAGVAFLISVALLVRRDAHKGYQNFDNFAQAPLPRV